MITAMTTTTNNQTPQNDYESRLCDAGYEIRSSESGNAIIRGYALKFGVSYDMGWYTESVDQRALDNADLSRVKALFNHDQNWPLGSVGAGTLRVWVDETGLGYENELPKSPNGENVRMAIERKDVTQSSWGFIVRTDSTGRRIGDKWEMRDGKEHRTFTDIATVLDVSPVTFPANPDTTVAKRSLEMYRSAENKEQEKPDLSDLANKIERVFALKKTHYTHK